VVINDFNVIGKTIFPPETDSPLLIDRYTPLSRPIALQLLQTIARRSEEIVDASGRVQHHQFASR
jgi:hypothetical protein